jgi:hypothetical protein
VNVSTTEFVDVLDSATLVGGLSVDADAHISALTLDIVQKAISI